MRGTFEFNTLALDLLTHGRWNDDRTLDDLGPAKFAHSACLLSSFTFICMESHDLQKSLVKSSKRVLTERLGQLLLRIGYVVRNANMEWAMVFVF